MQESNADEAHQWRVGPDDAGLRLDQFLAQQLPQYSRTFLRHCITGGGVQVDGRPAKVAYRLQPDQQVTVLQFAPPPEGPQPENIPLNVLYEDDCLAAIDKPAGMVVHPAKGHWQGTLTSALAYHFQSLSSCGGPARPGIVHRLDRDTSGVMVIAKTNAAHAKLAAQFEGRAIQKEYFALVVGEPDRDRDRIKQPIGPHPYHRQRMAIRRDHPDAREAESFYEVTQRLGRFAALRVVPHTGRTHQIRIHLTHIGHPVLCDRLYGGRAVLTRGELTGDATDHEVLLERQALHAARLGIEHPETGQPLRFDAPLPDDLAGTLAALRAAAP